MVANFISQDFRLEDYQGGCNSAKRVTTTLKRRREFVPSSGKRISVYVVVQGIVVHDRQKHDFAISFIWKLSMIKFKK